MKTLDRLLSSEDRQHRNSLLVRRRTAANRVIWAAVDLARIDAELATLGGPSKRRRMPHVLPERMARDLPIGLSAALREVRLPR